MLRFDGNNFSCHQTCEPETNITENSIAPQNEHYRVNLIFSCVFKGENTILFWCKIEYLRK